MSVLDGREILKMIDKIPEELKQQIEKLESEIADATVTGIVTVVEKWNVERQTFEQEKVLNSIGAEFIGDRVEAIHKNYSAQDGTYYRFMEYEGKALKPGVSLQRYENNVAELDEKKKRLAEIEETRDLETKKRQRFVERWGTFITSMAIFGFFWWLSGASLFSGGVQARNLNGVVNGGGRFLMVITGIISLLSLYGLFKYYIKERRTLAAKKDEGPPSQAGA
jgi:hypothetical protein